MKKAELRPIWTHCYSHGSTRWYRVRKRTRSEKVLPPSFSEHYFHRKYQIPENSHSIPSSKVPRQNPSYYILLGTTLQPKCVHRTSTLKSQPNLSGNSDARSVRCMGRVEEVGEITISKSTHLSANVSILGLVLPRIAVTTKMITPKSVSIEINRV